MATRTKFHLGYGTKFGPPAWQARSDRTHGSDWPTGRHFGALARQLEDACFDLLFLEDTLTVSRTSGGTMAYDVRNALYSPKHDPVALLANLAARTDRIGLVATASATFYPPFLLARVLSTIDSLSEGRVGWNIVTSTLQDEARNFGMELPAPAVRYDMADEYLELVKRLWTSWDRDALVNDPEAGVYVDPAKVHEVEFHGKYHSARGPLNTLPSPQQTPLLAQAGGSDRGRDFAAKHAEMVFALTSGGVPAMKAFREDMHRRMATFGRRPEDARIMWAARVEITHPDDPPPAEWDEARFGILLAYWSAIFDTDLSGLDPDEPLPAHLPPKGTTSVFERLQKDGREKGTTLREGLIGLNSGGDSLGGLVGTADDVAETLAGVIDEVGGDGFICSSINIGTAEHVRRLTQELVPRLQAMGCVRTEYSGSTLRENLFAF